MFCIDKVIRRDHKKKQALVKWNGYDDDLNCWIPINDLINISTYSYGIIYGESSQEKKRWSDKISYRRRKKSSNKITNKMHAEQRVVLRYM